MYSHDLKGFLLSISTLTLGGMSFTIWIQTQLLEKLNDLEKEHVLPEKTDRVKNYIKMMKIVRDCLLGICAPIFFISSIWLLIMYLP